MAERGQYGHQHRASAGLERAFVILKVIQYLCFFFKSISAYGSVFSLPLGARHVPNTTLLLSDTGRCQRCTGWPTCVPQATRVTSLPSCRTSAWDRGMVYASTGTCSTAEHTETASATHWRSLSVRSTFIYHLIDCSLAFARYVQIEIFREQWMIGWVTWRSKSTNYWSTTFLSHFKFVPMRFPEPQRQRVQSKSWPYAFLCQQKIHNNNYSLIRSWRGKLLQESRNVLKGGTPKTARHEDKPHENIV